MISRQDNSSTYLAGPPVFTFPIHWVLSAASYFDQFWARVLSAVCSSSRQASLSRPATMANRTAALQVGARSNLGGSSATATATCSTSNREATAIVSIADIGFPLVRAASAIPGIVAVGTIIQDYSGERRNAKSLRAGYQDRRWRPCDHTDPVIA